MPMSAPLSRSARPSRPQLEMLDGFESRSDCFSDVRAARRPIHPAIDELVVVAQRANTIASPAVRAEGRLRPSLIGRSTEDFTRGQLILEYLSPFDSRQRRSGNLRLPFGCVLQPKSPPCRWSS